jgi:hypothetical protein
MVTGYNICPRCKKKYSPKNESKMINMDTGEPVCMKCYRNLKRISELDNKLMGYGGYCASTEEAKKMKAEIRRLEKVV